MKRLEGKKRVFWKIIMQKLCWKINDAMKFIRDRMFCYYEVDLKQVKEKVKETNFKAEKFEQVEEHLPNIYAALQQLKEKNNCLKHDIKVLRGDLYELYIAYLTEDRAKISEIFSRLFEYKILR